MHLAKHASCDGESSKKRGPNVFIRLCVDSAIEKRKIDKAGQNAYDESTDPDTDNDINEMEINKIFLSLHEELMKIVSKTGAESRVTRDVVENTLCEMKRMWDVWTGTKEGEISLKTLPLMECLDKCFSVRNIEILADKLPSKFLDVIYIYRNRHAGRHVQKLFKLDIAKERLIMHTHVFNRRKHKHSIEKTDTTKHMFWSIDDKEFSISEELRSEYTSTLTCCQKELCDHCKLCLRANEDNSDIPTIIKNGTRTLNLNHPQNINNNMRKREFKVKGLPRISKKEIDLNELKTRYESQIEQKQMKRLKAKSKLISLKKQTIARSGNCSGKGSSMKKRKRSRARNSNIEEEDELVETTRNSKKLR